MKTAVSYVRVSSKEQSSEGFSIPAQKRLLEEYAQRLGLRVVQHFEDVETAKRAGRTAFDAMVHFLRQNKSCRVVLVEKTDRLYRNLRDMVTVDELGVEVHFVKESFVYSEASGSAQKLIQGIKGLLAKNYLDNLSEETSKGMLEKARQGLYPSYAPLGYVNDPATGGIVPDSDRAPIIQQLFEAYAGGKTSLSGLVRLGRQLGLRSRKGAFVPKATMAFVVANPIYVGEFRWRGVVYRGRHAPLISRELFSRAQDVLHERHRGGARKRQLAFRGLLKCGECGCAITGEVKKERYVYYHCTHGKGDCRQGAISEPNLAQLLGEPLKRLRVTPERAEWILQALRESHSDQQRFREDELRRLRADHDELERRISLAYEDRLSGVVPEAFWTAKYAQYRGQQEGITARMAALDVADSGYIESAERVLELSQRAYSLYVAQNRAEQRKLLDLLLSNCTLRDGAVRCDLRKPFDLIADGVAEEERLPRRGRFKRAGNEIWLPKRNSIRTRRQGPPEVWFRIQHVAPDDHNALSGAELYEQAVEIALGPKGAFDNESVGTLKRRVAANRVVNLAANARRPAKRPIKLRTPRVVEFLRKAQEWQRQLDAGEVRTRAEIAQRERITRARVTQIMFLLRLAPDIQENVLSMPDMFRRPAITERALRPIAQIKNRQAQIQAFLRLTDPPSATL